MSISKSSAIAAGILAAALLVQACSGDDAPAGPPAAHTLTVTLSGNGSGTVTSDPAGIDCTAADGTCSAAYDEATEVTLTAAADAGSGFVGWSGALTGTVASLAVTLDGDKTLTAEFGALGSPLSRTAAVTRAREAVIDSIAAGQAVLALAPQAPLPPGTDIFAAGDSTPTVTTADSAYFVFVDPHPAYMYGHPVLYLLVDARTGEVRQARATNVPEIDGTVLYHTLDERLTSDDRVEPAADDDPFGAPTGPAYAAAMRRPTTPTAWSVATFRSAAPAIRPAAEEGECRKVAVIAGAHDDQYILNSATRMGAMLGNAGFEVHAFNSVDHTFDEFRDGYLAAAEGLGPCDKFLFYFVGHTPYDDEDGDDKPDGGRVDDIVWALGQGEDVEQAISLIHFAQQYINDLTAGTVNIIIDACFSGSVIDHLTNPFSDRFAVKPQPGVEVNVFTSSAADRAAFGAWNWERIGDYLDGDGTELAAEYSEQIIDALEKATSDGSMDQDEDGTISVDEFEQAFQDAHDDAETSLGEDQKPGSKTFSGSSTEHELSVTPAGDGDGTVTSDPAGIDCTKASATVSGTCSAPFPEGTTVTLTGRTSDGSMVTGWNGAGTTDPAGTRSIIMDGPRDVGVDFPLVPAEAIVLDLLQYGFLYIEAVQLLRAQLAFLFPPPDAAQRLAPAAADGPTGAACPALLIAATEGAIAVDACTGEQLGSYEFGDWSFYDAHALPRPAGTTGEHAVLLTGENYAVFYLDDQGDIVSQIGQIGFGTVTDATPIGGDPSAGAVMTNNSTKTIHFVRFVPEAGYFRVLSEFAGVTHTPANVQSAFAGPTPATNALPPDELLAVGNTFDQGVLYHIDMHNESDEVFPEHTEIGALGGKNPRRIRCDFESGICAVSDFENSLVTVVLWDGTGLPTIAGVTAPGTLADGPVGLDIFGHRIVTAGFNDDQYSIIEVDAAGDIVSVTTKPVPEGCTQPGHATFLRDGSNTILLSCWGSTAVARVPGAF